jgi:rRNA maturation protein Nop10
MSGKGDTPRPVAGETYRANYDAIFSKGKHYPDWICAPCGHTHGRGMPEGHVSTWHEDTCGVCGKVTSVSEPRDFGHLKKWPILAKNP